MTDLERQLTAALERCPLSTKRNSGGTPEHFETLRQQSKPCSGKSSG